MPPTRPTCRPSWPPSPGFAALLLALRAVRRRAHSSFSWFLCALIVKSRPSGFWLLTPGSSQPPFRAPHSEFRTSFTTSFTCKYLIFQRLRNISHLFCLPIFTSPGNRFPGHHCIRVHLCESVVKCSPFRVQLQGQSNQIKVNQTKSNQKKYFRALWRLDPRLLPGSRTVLPVSVLRPIMMPPNYRSFRLRFALDFFRLSGKFLPCQRKH
jgi:hypothetical protein